LPKLDESQSLSLAKDINQELSKTQRYIQKKLEDKGYTLDKLLDNMIDIAENAEVSTATGDIIPAYKIRKEANSQLLEMAGFYKKK
jgi:hypothetical protein